MQNANKRRARVLDEIVAHKRDELAARKAARPLSELRARCADVEPPRDFAGALRRRGPLRLLAEIKRGSPSRGTIDAQADVAATVRTYADCGAAAISVLTDERYFLGHDSHVAEAKAACALPVLRKDFTLEAYHVWEARAIGADSVLLMAQVLSAKELRDLVALARELGMDPLVECHTEEELDRVLDSGAKVVGINNRDLRTLEIDLDTTLRLLDRIPVDRVVVSQSGFSCRADVVRVEATRVDAIQVGTSIMASGDVAAKIRELLGHVS